MFPELSELFRNIRKVSESFSWLYYLYRIWGQKYHSTGKSYLKWHKWTEAICNKRLISENFGMFRNVSENIIIRENGHYLHFLISQWYIFWYTVNMSVLQLIKLIFYAGLMHKAHISTHSSGGAGRAQPLLHKDFRQSFVIWFSCHLVASLAWPVEPSEHGGSRYVVPSQALCNRSELAGYSSWQVSWNLSNCVTSGRPCNNAATGKHVHLVKFL